MWPRSMVISEFGLDADPALGSLVYAVTNAPGLLASRVKMRSRVLLVVVVGLIFGSLIAGCASPSAAVPQATVRSFLTSWTHRDWAAMSRLVDHAAADFAKVNVVALTNLGVTKASYDAGAVTQHGEMASARVTEH